MKNKRLGLFYDRFFSFFQVGNLTQGTGTINTTFIKIAQSIKDDFHKRRITITITIAKNKIKTEFHIVKDTRIRMWKICILCGLLRYQRKIISLQYAVQINNIRSSFSKRINIYGQLRVVSRTALSHNYITIHVRVQYLLETQVQNIA